MSGPTASRRTAPRAGVLALVALLHLALLQALLQRLTPPLSARPPPIVRWLALVHVQPEPQHARRLRPSRRAVARPAPASLWMPPQAAEPPPAISSTGSAAFLATPTAAASAPLNLKLSHESLEALDRIRNPALDDPRGNSLPRTLEARMAQAGGSTICVIHERQDDGTVKRIEGRMVAVPTLSGGADPFGHSFSTGGGFGNEVGQAGTVAMCVKK